MVITTSKTTALFCPSSLVKDKQQILASQDFLQKHYQLNTCFQHETHEKTSAKERANILLDYLFNDTVGTLWALRGGEGSADLIPYLHEQRARIAKLQAKTLIGFSDSTALINYFAQHFQWPCWHGLTALQVLEGHLDAENLQHGLAVFFENKASLLQQLQPLNKAANNAQTLIGKLCGGNLSLLNISIGDHWEIDSKDKIIFIEEVNEKAHVIIRTLKYLQRIGKFKEVKAIILGDFSFSRQGNNEEQQAINRALRYFASTCEQPVLQTKEFGHGKFNSPLPLNHPCKLIINSEENSRLELA